MQFPSHGFGSDKKKPQGYYLISHWNSIKWNSIIFNEHYLISSLHEYGTPY